VSKSYFSGGNNAKKLPKKSNIEKEVRLFRSRGVYKWTLSVYSVKNSVFWSYLCGQELQ
jgi:hypothetical protein